jgi:exosortase/archaeosortase family protein
MASFPGIRSAPGWRSCALFLAVYFVLLALLAMCEGSAVGRAAVVVTARTTVWILWLFGTSAVSTGSEIQTAGIRIEVIFECTAFFAICIFLSGVLAFPARLSAKAKGLAVGLPGIFLLNEARIISLMYAHERAPRWYEALHLVIWPVALVFSVAVGWLVWAARTSHARS